MCDGAYASHKTMADYLTTKGMRATFYKDQTQLTLSTAQLLAMQADFLKKKDRFFFWIWQKN